MFDCYDDDEDTTELISFVMTTINPHVLISTYYIPWLSCTLYFSYLLSFSFRALDRNAFRVIVVAAAMIKREVYQGFLSKVPILQTLTGWYDLLFIHYHHDWFMYLLRD